MPGRDIIVIGASAGGFDALRQLVAGLLVDLPAAVLVVLHMSPTGKSRLADILRRAGGLPIVEPEDREAIEPGRMYLSRPDLHLLIEDGHIRLSRGPRENRCRPAIDPLFRSAAASFGPRTIGVVLSGMLDDGTAGLRAIKQAGGLAIVQDPREAVFSAMPQHALEYVKVDAVLHVEEIGPHLGRLAREVVADVQPSAEKIIVEADAAVRGMQAGEISQTHGEPSPISCPECGGVLWAIRDDDDHKVPPLVRYRCRTGHAYSPASLLDAQYGLVEEVLGSALRGLEENALLLNNMARRAAERGHSSAERYYRNLEGRTRDRTEDVRRLLMERFERPEDEPGPVSVTRRPG